MFRDTVGDRYNEEDRDYTREWNANLENYNRAWKEDERTYSRAEDAYQRALAAAQAAKGYTGDNSALEDFYGWPRGSIAAWEAQQALLKGGSGGGSGRSRGGGSRSGRGGGGGGGDFYPVGNADISNPGTRNGPILERIQRAYTTMSSDQFDNWVSNALNAGEFTEQDYDTWNSTPTAYFTALRQKSQKDTAKKKAAKTLKSALGQ